MRIGRVEVTGGFFLLMAWLNYLDREFVIPMAVLACSFHEAGHYGVIRLVGGDIKLIRLTAIGAEMILKRPLGYWQEGLSALAGPVVNLVLALMFCGKEWGVTFAGLNLALAFFNLLPVGRLDGGRVLNCTLSLVVGTEWAGAIGRWVDCVGAALLLVVGTYVMDAGGNMTLLLVSGWVLAVVLKQNNCLTKGKKTCKSKKNKLQLKVRV